MMAIVLYLLLLLHLFLDLAALDLVRFRRDDDRREPRLQDPVIHHHVLPGGGMPDVQEQEDRPQLPAFAQVPLDHFPPLLLDLDIGLRIPVSREVHEMESAIDLIVIDRLGLAGLGAHAGEGFPIHEPVDERRFSHVAPARKGKFREGSLGDPAGDPADECEIYRFNNRPDRQTNENRIFLKKLDRIGVLHYNNTDFFTND